MPVGKSHEEEAKMSILYACNSMSGRKEDEVVKCTCMSGQGSIYLSRGATVNISVLRAYISNLVDTLLYICYDI